MDRQPFSKLTSLQLEHQPRPHPSEPANCTGNLPTAEIPNSNRIIRMESGPCGFQGRRGLILPCSCAQGIFTYHPDSGAFRDTCEICGHASSMHEDINVIAGS